VGAGRQARHGHTAFLPHTAIHRPSRVRGYRGIRQYRHLQRGAGRCVDPAGLFPAFQEPGKRAGGEVKGMNGLPERDLQEIVRILTAHPQIRRARLFGSRAKGTHTAGSDVDLALDGELTFALLGAVSRELNQESTMPYRFDVLDYGTIESKDLKEHIDRVGVALLDTQPPSSVD